MRLSRWAFVALLWMLCVGAVGGGAWYAIDSAGRQVAVLAGNGVTSPAPEQTSSDGGPAVGQGDDGPAEPSGDAPGTPSPGTTGTTGKARPAPAAEPTDGPDDRPSSSTTTATQPDRTSRTTSPPRSSRTTTTTEPSTPTSSRTTTSTPQDRPRTRTASTDGGTVSVTCRAGSPLEYGVNPAQGWSASDHTSGTQDVSVKLRRPGRVIEVQATCVDGVPRISVDESDHEDDD